MPPGSREAYLTLVPAGSPQHTLVLQKAVGELEGMLGTAPAGEVAERAADVRRMVQEGTAQGLLSREVGGQLVDAAARAVDAAEAMQEEQGDGGDELCKAELQRSRVDLQRSRAAVAAASSANGSTIERHQIAVLGCEVAALEGHLASPAALHAALLRTAQDWCRLRAVTRDPNILIAHRIRATVLLAESQDFRRELLLAHKMHASRPFEQLGVLRADSRLLYWVSALHNHTLFWGGLAEPCGGAEGVAERLADQAPLLARALCRKAALDVGQLPEAVASLRTDLELTARAAVSPGSWLWIGVDRSNDAYAPQGDVTRYIPEPPEQLLLSAGGDHPGGAPPLRPAEEEVLEMLVPPPRGAPRAARYYDSYGRASAVLRCAVTLPGESPLALDISPLCGLSLALGGDRPEGAAALVQRWLPCVDWAAAERQLRCALRHELRDPPPSPRPAAESPQVWIDFVQGETRPAAAPTSLLSAAHAVARAMRGACQLSGEQGAGTAQQGRLEHRWAAVARSIAELGAGAPAPAEQPPARARPSSPPLTPPQQPLLPEDPGAAPPDPPAQGRALRPAPRKPQPEELPVEARARTLREQLSGQQGSVPPGAEEFDMVELAGEDDPEAAAAGADLAVQAPAAAVSSGAPAPADSSMLVPSEDDVLEIGDLVQSLQAPPAEAEESKPRPRGPSMVARAALASMPPPQRMKGLPEPVKALGPGLLLDDGAAEPQQPAPGPAGEAPARAPVSPPAPAAAAVPAPTGGRFAWQPPPPPRGRPPPPPPQAASPQAASPQAATATRGRWEPPRPPAAPGAAADRGAPRPPPAPGVQLAQPPEPWSTPVGEPAPAASRAAPPAPAASGAAAASPPAPPPAPAVRAVPRAAPARPPEPWSTPEDPRAPAAVPSAGPARPPEPWSTPEDEPAPAALRAASPAAAAGRVAHPAGPPAPSWSPAPSGWRLPEPPPPRSVPPPAGAGRQAPQAAAPQAAAPQAAAPPGGRAQHGTRAAGLLKALKPDGEDVVRKIMSTIGEIGKCADLRQHLVDKADCLALAAGCLDRHLGDPVAAEWLLALMHKVCKGRPSGACKALFMQGGDRSPAAAVRRAEQRYRHADPASVKWNKNKDNFVRYLDLALRHCPGAPAAPPRSAAEPRAQPEPEDF